MHYKIARAKTIIELEDKINRLVEVGYIPIGGILSETERNRIKTNDQPTGEWETVVWYIQPVFRTIPESSISKLKDFNIWDRFASKCSIRDNNKCTHSNTEGKECNPTICPRRDKPIIK